MKHLFFDCCVAKSIWAIIAGILDLRSDWDFEYMATFWLTNKKHVFTNIVSSAVIWCLWNFRNKMCFQGLVWTGEKAVLLWIARMLRRWKPMYTQDLEIKVNSVIQELELLVNQPPRLCWNGGTQFRLEMSASQSSEQVYGVVTLRDDQVGRDVPASSASSEDV